MECHVSNRHQPKKLHLLPSLAQGLCLRKAHRLTHSSGSHFNMGTACQPHLPEIWGRCHTDELCSDEPYVVFEPLSEYHCSTQTGSGCSGSQVGEVLSQHPLPEILFRESGAMASQETRTGSQHSKPLPSISQSERFTTIHSNA